MGQAPPGTACNKEGLGTPFVKAGEFRAVRPVIREWTTKPLKAARASDVLICVVGATSGKLNLGADCAIGRSVAAIRPSEASFDRFLFYQLLQHVERLRNASTGSAQGVISSQQLVNIPVSLPPRAEQDRIVARIDELFSRIDAGVESLKRAKALLGRYRQAVLKAAVTGELTRDWRKVHAGQGETGGELLRRILAERRRRWEEPNSPSCVPRASRPRTTAGRTATSNPPHPI